MLDSSIHTTSAMPGCFPYSLKSKLLKLLHSKYATKTGTSGESNQSNNVDEKKQKGVQYCAFGVFRHVNSDISHDIWSHNLG